MKPLSADALRNAEVAARAARPPSPAVPTIELRNPGLRDALAALAREPTALTHLHVAEEYQRAGVLDQAFDHFDEALRLAPRLAAAYDGRARIWRDWHIPAAGLGDSSRAVYLRPNRRRRATHAARCSLQWVSARPPAARFRRR